MKLRYFLFLIAFKSYGVGVYHLVHPDSNFLTIALNRACSTNIHMSKGFACNSALFNYEQNQGLQFLMAGKADGNAIENGKKLIFDPINEDFLRDLFEVNNFNSFTFNTDIDFITDLFILSYSPYYLIADIYIFNPAFSEATVYLVNQETLKATSGFQREFEFMERQFNASFGFTAQYMRRFFSDDSFNLLQLGVQEPGDLVGFDEISTVAGDAAFMLDPGVNTWIPAISMQVKNMGSAFGVNQNRFESVSQLEPFLVSEFYSTAGIGYNFKTDIGLFSTGIEFPFEELYQNIYTDYISWSGFYKIGLFSIVSSLSKFHQTGGFYFESDLTQIGILYAYEQDLGNFSNFSDEAIYLSLEFAL